MPVAPSESLSHESYSSLSQKERETLRLILGGHDAKSAARHLGLSVHTVNERLRDARRKLGVSSSREAARRLRAFEGAAPDNLGDSAFGDAPATAEATEARQPIAGEGMGLRAGWVIGGLIMSTLLAVLAYAALSAPDSTPAPAAPAAAAPAAESAAATAARIFLEHGDRSEWAANYALTSRSFQSLNTVETWTSVSQRVRPPLGAVIERTLISDDYVPAPPEGYRMIRFRTRFAAREEAIETLSLALEDGAWKVAGITID